MLLFTEATQTASFTWVDIVIIAILLIGVIVGVKKGFIDQLFALVGVIAVLVAALLLCKPIANALLTSDSGVIFDRLSAFLQEKFGGWEYYTTTPIVWSDVETNKHIIDTALQMVGAPAFLIGFGVFNGLFKGFSAEATTLAEQLPQQLTALVNCAIAFVVLFIVLLIVLAVVKKFFKNIVQLPLIKQIDKFLGAVFALVKNLALIVVILTVISILSSVVAPLGNFLNEVVYGQSWIGQNVLKPIMEIVLQFIAKT